MNEPGLPADIGAMSFEAGRRGEQPVEDSIGQPHRDRRGFVD